MKRVVAVIVSLLLSLAAYSQTGTWSGKVDVQGTSLSVVFHIEETGCTFDSPDQGARGIPAEASLSDLGKVVIKVPSIGATYEGLWLGGRIVGSLSQSGSSFPLTLVPGEPELKRPQTPLGPFPYSCEEVSFSNGDAVLKGTLVLPEGYTRDTPAVIMVTGSGQQNRDEEILGHKPFAVIADALARNGIASLRYDDRGFGESTGDAVFCTTADLKDDALAGIGLLRERFGKVGVIGHSEGGTIALMIAAEGKADFIVSLAGMVVSGKELLLWQNRSILASSGFDQESVMVYCKLLEEAFDATIAGLPLPSAEGKDLPDVLVRNYQATAMQLKSPYLSYFIELDARKSLDRICCPVLALNGTKDAQVWHESNLGALKAGLPSTIAARIEPVEGVNHLFQHCSTGAATEYREIEETFAPEVLGLIVGWIRSL
ncbi:MAG: alpha/beta fold hydrolase [Bacteroidales bacterium]|nr:alpha/beta fold hydrolase [Bacteroidales bacterium]